MRSAALILLWSAGCSAPNTGNQYLDVTVTFGAGVTARCVKVVVSTEAGAEKATRPMKVNGATPLRVGVYRDDLPATVSVQAQGYSDDACATRADPTEESAKTAATFGAPPTEVALKVERAAALDADHDGFSPPSDCNDADPTIKPGAVELCGDGKDNDCAAGADCADLACDTRSCGTGATCVSSTCREQDCSDGVDGDGDGALDCADSDCDFQACGSGARCVSSLCAEQSCTDGADNDGDGTRDCADSDCAAAACGLGGTCTAGVCREPTETICDDGLSNDADALVDCADPDCASRACADGNACTAGEVCSGSSCGGGTATVCAAPPGACFSMAGTCAPSTGQCSYAPQADGATCDDADPCSTPDHCNGDGGCVSSPRACAAPPSVCFGAGVCQAALDGGCAYPVLTGGGCTDGNNCTSGDTCAADGGCTGGALTTCTPAECFVFTPGDCELDAGCRFTPAPVNTACVGGKCNGSGTCVPNPTFTFVPDNFVPAQHPASGDLTIDCALAFNSGPDAGFGAPCSGMQLPTVSFADGGAAGTLTVLSVSSLTITDAGSLTLSGSRPVVIAVWGSASLSGPLYANSSATPRRDGPGAAPAATCATRAGGPGRDNGSRGGGGGGAGFFSFGAKGGGGNSDATTGGDGGADDPNGDVPLLVGCPGGTGKTDSATTPGGAGGGALQLSVAGTLTLNAIVSTSAEGGAGGTDGSEPGGGGGGSGGALNLQANRIVVTGNARLTSNGGAGGGGAQGNNASRGADGSTNTDIPATGGLNEAAGGPGGDGAAGTTDPVGGTTATKGGGGGGGAMGRIFIKHVDTGMACSVASGAVISPAARRVNCP